MADEKIQLACGMDFLQRSTRKSRLDVIEREDMPKTNRYDNPGPKLLDISYNYVSAQDNANTVVSIAPSKPHDVETSTEANFRNEIEPQAVPDSYTTNIDDSPYVEEPFQDSGSSYAPSEEYVNDSTSDAMEKAPDEEQESSRYGHELLFLEKNHSFVKQFFELN
ncbi:hypothetical protein FQA39_LY03764 [Lamprigera yunnana]|nr:hypothetical protein FQA39_LY03764 [Lamprigera yunnana]